MSPRFLLSAAALIALSAPAVTAQHSTARAKAKAFTLDSVAPAPAPTDVATPDTTPPADATPASVPAPDAAPAPTPTAPTLAAPSLPENAAVAATPSPTRGVFTLDTPIQDLIADPGAKGVLDKDLPGMSEDENLAKFKMLSLRSLQPQTGGQLTDAMLAKVASDLDVLAGGTGRAALVAPVKAGNSKRNRDVSR